jgi:hypothetical protein
MAILNSFQGFTRVVFILILSVIAGELAYGQYETASVLGVVHDASGGVIPGAKVILINIATTLETTETADSQGQFEFTSVRIGQYKVKACTRVQRNPYGALYRRSERPSTRGREPETWRNQRNSQRNRRCRPSRNGRQ